MCFRRWRLCAGAGCGWASGIQTARAGGILRELDLPADLIATSDDWGASKPNIAFLEHVIKATPAGPGEILYVGDRLDNDIRPAAQAGLLTELVLRGPWGTIQQDDPAADALATMRLDSLVELPELVLRFNAKVGI